MLRNHLKIALRSLVKNKVYSVINVTGLSLGIFGSLVVFQLVKFHLNTDTHHQKADRIYRVVTDLHLDDGSVEHEKGSPFVLHTALKNDFSNIEEVAYVGQQEMTLLVPKANGRREKFLEKEAAAFVNAAYFQMFDYQWLVGTPALLNAPDAVVLTERYATKYFGQSNPINQLVKIVGLGKTEPLKVVGIVKNLPETTDLRTEVFLSLPTVKNLMSGESLTDWQWIMRTRETYVLLKNSVFRQTFEAQLPAFAKKYYGEDAKYYRFRLQPLSDVHFNLDYGGKIARTNIYLYSVIGVLLIVVACINFVNLATAQSFSRFKEIGIRKTLGGSRLHIFWQFITEFLLITVLSVSVALVLASLAVPLVSRWFEIHITAAHLFDTQTLLFLPFLVVFTVLIAGFYPSVVVSGYSPLYALKGADKCPKTGFSLRKSLVVAQFGVAVALMVASGVVLLQINYLHNKDIGSAKDLIVHVEVPNPDNLELLKNRIRQKSYVESVSFIRHAPLSGPGAGGTIKFENRDWEKFVARSKIADENYLDTYRIKLIAGRRPVASDTIREILINRKLVTDLGLKTPEAALNKRLLVGAADGTGIIVGVTADFHNADLYTVIEPTVIHADRSSYNKVAIRLNKYSDNIRKELASIWESVDPDDVFVYSFYDEELTRFYRREELLRNVVVSFALLSVFVSCLGLLGLASMAVAQRTKEIGIRKVLGASVSSIAFLLSKGFLKLVLVAVVLASPIAYYFMDKWLSNFAYHIDIAWWVFGLAGLLAVLVALITVSFQAIKAALTNPVKSLRSE